jgi:predicted lipoprotein with Yx(FWY)xxD motif
MKHRPKFSSLHRRSRGLTVASLMAGLAVGGAAVIADIASAKPPSTLGIATNVRVKNNSDSIVIDAHGLTVYTLSGESVHHLQCTKANTCLKFWFPVKVNSQRTKLTAAHGISGKLGTLHRDGFYQVTLAGHPLYTFIGDGTKKHSVTGQGIVSFGGTWKVIATKSSPAHSSSTTSTSTSSTTSTSSSTRASAYPY